MSLFQRIVDSMVVAAQEPFALIDWPLQQVRGAVNPEGEGESWGFNVDPVLVGNALGIDMEYRDPNPGLEFLADATLDPLNLVGGGLFKRGMKAGEALWGTKASLGRPFAAADNYIPNYYVPNAEQELNQSQQLVLRALQYAQENPDSKLLDKAVETVPELRPHVERAKKLNPEQTRGTAQRLGSTLETLREGSIQALRDFVSPRSRALWNEQGISGSGQRIIQGHLDRYDEITEMIERLPVGSDERKALEAMRLQERGLAKAGAEAVYQSHIGTQAGRVGPKSEALMNFERNAFDEFPQSNEAGTITSIMQRHHPWRRTTRTQGTGRQVKAYEAAPLSEADAKFIEDHIQGAWPGTNRVVVKTPEKVTSGKHQFDLTGPRNPSMMVFRRIMKGNPSEGQPWADYVTEQVDLFNKNATHKVRVKTGEDGSVWLSSSRPGTAIVEGGFNGIHKIEPDGNYIAVMSDEHNFLEQLPGLGKLFKKYLPNNLVAITPPIRGQIGPDGKSIEGAYQSYSSPNVSNTHRGVPMERSPKGEDSLREIAASEPSAAALLAEQDKQVGLGLLTAGMLDRNRGEENEEQ